jgi:hypothetical protein
VTFSRPQSLSRFAAFVLDNAPPAAAAYSVRRLRTGYTGPCIRVRRSSDNAEQDFGFRDNVLDTTALLAFVGASNGFATTWYDQSGNGRNALNATSAQQPRIVNAGAVEVLGSVACPRFISASQTFLATLAFASGATEFTGLAVARLNSNTQFQRFLSVNDNTLANDFSSTASVALLLSLGTSGTLIGSYRNNATRSQATATIGTAANVIATVNASGAATSYVNGTGGSASSLAGSLGTNVALWLGDEKSRSGPLNGFMGETMFFHSALPTAERQRIQRNQGAFFGVTVV